MALIHPQRVDDKTRDEIKLISAGYDSMTDFFVKTLSEGIATIAASVYPNPCVVRMSDFKTNEYASLVGGKFFEPVEANPMIGFRGAARYAHPSYEEGFALECAAMKRVRDEMGFTNVILMIPFCRRVQEGELVLKTMEKYGLRRGKQLTLGVDRDSDIVAFDYDERDNGVKNRHHQIIQRWQNF